MTGPGQAPTRAAVLELKEEHIVVSEAYDFLDEKRLLLAAEIIRQLEAYERLEARLQILNQKAEKHLTDTVEQLGLQGLSVYPAPPMDEGHFDSRQSNFMGVTLVETDLRLVEWNDKAYCRAATPSNAAEQGRFVFREIVQLGAQLAGVSGNLHRLSLEYRLTERRARALENVILPEIVQSLKEMSTLLEELDLEDAIRARSKFHKGLV